MKKWYLRGLTNKNQAGQVILWFEPLKNYSIFFVTFASMCRSAVCTTAWIFHRLSQPL